MTTQDHPLFCFSHLRWPSVHERPRHLLTRCAKEREVYFVEEPLFDDFAPSLETMRIPSGVTVVVPHLPAGMRPAQIEAAQREMIDRLIATLDGASPVLWYYTPMALPFTHHIDARAVVYDCMDELSLFQGAPPELREREAQLLRLVDVVFTDGHSLDHHDRDSAQHANIPLSTIQNAWR